MKFFEQRRLINGIMIVSLLLNLAMLAYLAKSGGLRRFFVKIDMAEPVKTREQFQKDLEAKYRKLPDSSAEVAFVGDSLIGDGPWAEILTEIHNRGIGGETTAGLLDRLDEITSGKPARIFLLIGTNDLAGAVPEAQVLRNYRKILERLRAETPQTQVNVLALFPVNPSMSAHATQSNATINSVNRQLKELVAEFPGVRFLDLTSHLTNQAGELRPELSVDGIHLNVDGYLTLRKPLQDVTSR